MIQQSVPNRTYRQHNRKGSKWKLNGKSNGLFSLSTLPSRKARSSAPMTIRVSYLVYARPYHNPLSWVKNRSLEALKGRQGVLYESRDHDNLRVPYIYCLGTSTCSKRKQARQIGQVGSGLHKRLSWHSPTETKKFVAGTTTSIRVRRLSTIILEIPISPFPGRRFRTYINRCLKVSYSRAKSCVYDFFKSIDQISEAN